MSTMTDSEAYELLDELRRNPKPGMESEHMDAIDIAMSKFPKPERKTPGRIMHDAYAEATRCDPWEILPANCRSGSEAGAAAVLKECAVQPEDVTEEDVLWLLYLHSTPNLTTLQRLIRRIQERKGQ